MDMETLVLKSNVCRGIFVTEHAGMLVQKFFLRRMQAGTTFWNLFSWP
jgi:hypothetical protein